MIIFPRKIVYCWTMSLCMVGTVEEKTSHSSWTGSLPSLFLLLPPSMCPVTLTGTLHNAKTFRGTICLENEVGLQNEMVSSRRCVLFRNVWSTVILAWALLRNSWPGWKLDMRKGDVNTPWLHIHSGGESWSYMALSKWALQACDEVHTLCHILFLCCDRFPSSMISFLSFLILHLDNRASAIYTLIPSWLNFLKIQISLFSVKGEICISPRDIQLGYLEIASSSMSNSCPVIQSFMIKGHWKYQENRSPMFNSLLASQYCFSAHIIGYHSTHRNTIFQKQEGKWSLNNFFSVEEQVKTETAVQQRNTSTLWNSYYCTGNTVTVRQNSLFRYNTTHSNPSRNANGLSVWSRPQLTAGTVAPHH